MDENILQISEFFDSGVGLDFYIKSMYSGTHIKFREELQGFLRMSENYWQRYKTNGPWKKIDLLIGLDQYGDNKVFSTQEINDLLTICDDLSKKYHSTSLDDQKVRYFSSKLKELCEEALLANNLIIAITD